MIFKNEKTKNNNLIKKILTIYFIFIKSFTTQHFISFIKLFIH